MLGREEECLRKIVRGAVVIAHEEWWSVHDHSDNPGDNNREAIGRIASSLLTQEIVGMTPAEVYSALESAVKKKAKG